MVVRWGGGRNIFVADKGGHNFFIFQLSVNFASSLFAFCHWLASYIFSGEIPSAALGVTQIWFGPGQGVLFMSLETPSHFWAIL